MKHKLNQHLNKKFNDLSCNEKFNLLYPKPTELDLAFGRVRRDGPLAVIYDGSKHYWTNIYTWQQANNITLTNDQQNFVINGGRMIVTASGMIKLLYKREPALKPNEIKELKIIK